MHITSSRNPLLQQIRRAARDGRPTEDGLIVAEGPHLVKEALASSWTIERIIVAAEDRADYQNLLTAVGRIDVVEASALGFSSISTTKTTQGILALVRPRNWNRTQLLSGNALLVVLDGIQDPGNAGSIVRSAEAFGATGVVFLRDSVQVANGKFLRASAGSIFRLPYLANMTGPELSKLTSEFRINAYALAADGATSLLATDLREPLALIVGSEGNGVSREMLSASRSVSIPTDRVESLNAAVACSIALFEARRQRSQS